jgi:hypothetical protein
MKTMLNMTVVIRSPVYSRLVSELSAFPGARSRAGLLKRLAEEGARAACTSMPDSGVELSYMPAVGHSKEESPPFDIRVAIRAEEFPHLYAALEGEHNPRARAAILKRFAEEALRRQGSERTSENVRQVGAVQDHKVSTTEGDLHLLSLSAGLLPPDLLAGFGGNSVAE